MDNLRLSDKAYAYMQSEPDEQAANAHPTVGSRWIKPLLAAMASIQIIWLLAVALSGATENWPKIITLVIYTAICFVFFAFAPARFFMRVREAAEPVVARPVATVIFLCVLVAGVGLIYAYVQRIWTWDEENSLWAATILAQDGLDAFFVEYVNNPWLSRFHPPLAPIIYGYALRILGTQLYFMRIVALAMTCGTILLVYWLGSKMYNRQTALIASLFFISFPLTFRLGTAAMTDMPVTFFFLAAICLAYQLALHPSYWTAVLLGLASGAGILTKYTMGLVGPVLLAFFVVDARFRRLPLHFLVAAIIAATMLGVWILFASQIGVLAQQQTGIVTEFKTGYFVTESEGQKWLLESILTKLPSAIGLYNLPIAAIGLWFLLKSRRNSDILLLSWMSVVAVLLLLSLPDHRYFLVTFPAIAMAMAYGLRHFASGQVRVLLFSLASWIGSLYLFYDWLRLSGVFNECGTVFC